MEQSWRGACGAAASRAPCCASHVHQARLARLREGADVVAVDPHETALRARASATGRRAGDGLCLAVGFERQLGVAKDRMQEARRHRRNTVQAEGADADVRRFAGDPEPHLVVGIQILNCTKAIARSSFAEKRRSGRRAGASPPWAGRRVMAWSPRPQSWQKRQHRLASVRTRPRRRARQLSRKAARVRHASSSPGCQHCIGRARGIGCAPASAVRRQARRRARKHVCVLADRRGEVG